MSGPSISARFFINASVSPEKLAVVCEDDKLSYQKLAQRVLEWSHLLHSNGVERGDHLAVILPNSLEFVVVMLVAADLGLVLVPLNTSLPITALDSAIIHADVQHIIASPTIAKGLERSSIQKQGLWLSCKLGGNSLDAIHGTLRAPKDYRQEPYNLGRLSDPYILTMTSGSTAEPKPIILSQQTKVLRAEAAMSLYGVTVDDNVLAATPLYHSLAERLVIMPLLCGATAVVINRYSAEHWLETVKQFQISFTMAVSSQLKQIKELLETDKTLRVNSLRCVVSSSAALEYEVKERLIALLGCHFHECYGTSEVATVTDLNERDDQTKLDSVGKAITGVDIQILIDSHRLAGVGETGEIICKTPMQFSGYYAQPDSSERSLWCGYFCTGDIGFLDKDGYLHYRGRIKELIITGGINVYPVDIETVIASFEGVQECAVYASPDEQLGEVVAAAVVPEQGTIIDERRLRYHCVQQLADYQLPRKISIVEQLPKNTMGKVVRRKLSQQMESLT